MVKFLRRDCARYSKFGNGRGKKAKWRAPKGRDNKMREKRSGYPAVVSIGYKSKQKKAILTINNPKDLVKASKDDVLIVASVGEKKKVGIAKKAKELGLSFKNINIKSFLEKINKKEKKDESKK